MDSGVPSTSDAAVGDAGALNDSGMPGDAGTAGGAGAERVNRMAFGLNLPWTERGGGVALGGELLRDRSFRAFGRTNSPWFTLPGSGTFQFHADAGDTFVDGGHSYPGALVLQSSAPGLTCVGQAIPATVRSGPHTVSLSVRAVGSPAPVAVYLDDASYTSVLATSTFAAPPAVWSRPTFTWSLAAEATRPILLVCLSGAGEVAVDEVRVIDEAPFVMRSDAQLALQSLGATALRWPGGTVLDSFDWKQAVGPAAQRGELNGYEDSADPLNIKWETPVFGLHELLDTCESLGLEPVLGINLLAGAASAADFVEYVLGPATSTQGTRRAANGRLEPWRVRFFQLGNEPTPAYSADRTSNLDDWAAGAHAAQLTKPIAEAIRAKAQTLGIQLVLSGVLEGSFQQADWLAVSLPKVDLLRNWNALATAEPAPLQASVETAQINFYSYFGSDLDPAVQYQALLAGGEVLRRTVRGLPAFAAPQVWVAEFHVDLRTAADVIRPERLVDFQAGLELADILLTVIDLKFAGAMVFNFSEQVGYGLTDVSGGFVPRPTGSVYTLLAPLVGDALVDAGVGVSPGGRVLIATGTGNVPSVLEYDAVTSLVTRADETGRLRWVILNRSLAQTQRLSLTLPGLGSGRAHVTRLEAALDFTLDGGGVLQALESTVAVDGGLSVDVAAHSLTRVDFER